MDSDLQGRIDALYKSARAAGDRESRTHLLSSAEPNVRRVVESMLAQDDANVEPTVVATGVDVGTQLGRYVTEAPLGKGGMRAVLRARDTKAWPASPPAQTHAASAPQRSFSPCHPTQCGTSHRTESVS